MQSTMAKLGVKVRRIKDNSWSQAGVVVRIGSEMLDIYWPSDDITEKVPIAQLEPYDLTCDEVAA